MPMKQNKAREALSKMFLDSLSEECLPWQKPWINSIPGFGDHLNPVSGTRYHGVNAVLLWAIASMKGYGDPRWCTFKQATENGWKIKKGEHGTPVEFWSYYDVVAKMKISPREFERIREEEPDRVADIKPCSSVYIVFNGAQLEGVPELPDRNHIAPEYQNKLLDSFTATYLSTENIQLITGESAAYNATHDHIVMPPKEAFLSEEAYFDTLLHECAHSTGSETRLARNFENRSHQEYAIEELRAEISGAFLISAAGASGSQSVTDNNKAYVQSWAAAIKNDPNVLFRAIKDADKIADFVIDKGQLSLWKEKLQAEISNVEVSSFDLQEQEEWEAEL